MLFRSVKDPATFFLQFTDKSQKLSQHKATLQYNHLQHPLILETRYNPQFRPAYINITYNPLNNKNKKNIVWFQYLTKPTTKFNKQQYKCVITNIPLYTTLFKYDDYIQKTLGPFTNTEQVNIMCMICPYTEPPLLRKIGRAHV